jgi:hypothetical protein
VPSASFAKISAKRASDYPLPQLCQLCHLRQPLPQFRQPLCQLPQPVSWKSLSFDAGLVCSAMAVRTRATLSEIVAREESLVSTLAEDVFGVRLAHASSCKAAARSEGVFFMSNVFLSSDADVISSWC